jgi:hypothetical protein
LPALARDYEQQELSEIWNIPISDQVMSPRMRRVMARGHGVI